MSYLITVTPATEGCTIFHVHFDAHCVLLGDISCSVLSLSAPWDCPLVPELRRRGCSPKQMAVVFHGIQTRSFGTSYTIDEQGKVDIFPQEVDFPGFAEGEEEEQEQQEEEEAGESESESESDESEEGEEDEEARKMRFIVLLRSDADRVRQGREALESFTVDGDQLVRYYEEPACLNGEIVAYATITRQESVTIDEELDAVLVELGIL